MLEEARKILRITSMVYDEEIQGLLDAAVKDLQLAGATGVTLASDDALVKRALLTYVKAHFGWENNDHERLLNAYAAIKHEMLLSGEYAEGA